MRIPVIMHCTVWSKRKCKHDLLISLLWMGNLDGKYVSQNTFTATIVWRDQGERVGCRIYGFWDIGKQKVQICLFYIGFFSIDISVTRYPFLMGFASKCSIFKLPESGVKVSIFDMWFISLDRVTIVIYDSDVTAQR